MIIVTFSSHSYSSCGVLSKSCHIIAAVLVDAVAMVSRKLKALKRLGI